MICVCLPAAAVITTTAATATTIIMVAMIRIHHPPHLLFVMATMIGIVIDVTEVTMSTVGEVIWICVGKGTHTQ